MQPSLFETLEAEIELQQIEGVADTMSSAMPEGTAEEGEWSRPIAMPPESETRRLVGGIMKVLDHEAHYFSSQVESFTQSLDLIWLALQPFKEEEYMALVGKMRPQAVAAAKKVMDCLMPMYSENVVDDILGNVYMEIRSNWKGHGLGQFFTPMAICEMMNLMNLDVPGAIDRYKTTGEKTTICDPCCGSGAQLLGAKRVIMKQAGYAGLDAFGFYGQDVDPICVTMCRIQMKLTDYRYMADRLIVAAHQVREQIRPDGRA